MASPQQQMMLGTFKKLDTVVPTISTAIVGTNGLVLTLGFDGPVVAGAAGFSSGLAITNSGDATVATYVSGTGTATIVYSLSAVVNVGDVLTLTYTQPGTGIKDIANNMLGTCSGLSITNNSVVASDPMLVQQKTGVAFSADLTVTFDAPITPGNTIIVCVGSTDAPVSIATNENAESFTSAADDRSTLAGACIWYSGAIFNADSGVTINMDFTTNNVSANVQEWSGLKDGAFDGQFNKNDDAIGSTNVSAGIVTPQNNNSVVIACADFTANDYSSGPTNSYSRLTPASATVTYLESAYFLQPTAGATSTAWTLTAGINWAAVTASFQPQ